MTNITQTERGVKFETVSGIAIKYDETSDILHVGECQISPHFFELLKKSAMAGERIQLGVVGDNNEVLFTKMNSPS